MWNGSYSTDLINRLCQQNQSEEEIISMVIYFFENVTQSKKFPILNKYIIETSSLLTVPSNTSNTSTTSPEIMREIINEFLSCAYNILLPSSSLSPFNLISSTTNKFYKLALGTSSSSSLKDEEGLLPYDFFVNLYVCLETMHTINSIIRRMRISQLKKFNFLDIEDVKLLQALWVNLLSKDKDENSPQITDQNKCISCTSLSSSPTTSSTLSHCESCGSFISKDEDNTFDEDKIGSDWTKLGFQSQDPTSDLRGGGILSLQQLVYFSREYREQAKHILEIFSSGSKNSSSVFCTTVTNPALSVYGTNRQGGYFPFALIGINITHFLNELIKERRLHHYLIQKLAVIVSSTAFDQLQLLLHDEVIDLILHAREQIDSINSENENNNNNENKENIDKENLKKYWKQYEFSYFYLFGNFLLNSREEIEKKRKKTFNHNKLLYIRPNHHHYSSYQEKFLLNHNNIVSLHSSNTNSSSTSSIDSYFSPSPSSEDACLIFGENLLHDFYVKIFESLFLKYVILAPPSVLDFNSIFDDVKAEFRNENEPIIK